MADAASLVQQGFNAHQSGDLERASQLYHQALTHDLLDFDALQLLGVLSIHQQDHAAAEVWLVRALEVAPNSIAALLNYALVLQELERPEAALDVYAHALTLAPDNAAALNGRGMVLSSIGREEEAFAALDAAVAADVRLTEARFNRATMLDRRGQHEAAQLDYQQVLALEPNYPEAMYQLGISLLNTRQFGAGLDWLEKLLAIEPGHRLAAHQRSLTAWHFCDWTDYDQRRQALIQDALAGQAAATVFQFLSVTDDAKAQLRLAQSQCERLGLNLIHAEATGGSSGQAGARIRLAYVAADFREHAVSYLTAGLFELHDRERFEVIGVSFGPRTGDAMQRRVFSAFDRVIEIHDLPDDRAAALVRESGIDIAIDLTGATQNARPALFAHRLAPIQINYLGFPGTLWRSCYDYIIGDSVVIPQCQVVNYAETVAFMPEVFQVNDHRREMRDAPVLRAHYGLVEGRFVFCAFHSSFKINPPVFSVWMRLLIELPGSVLWLAITDLDTRRYLVAAAAIRGVPAERLVFAEVVPYAEHLARCTLADLALDSFPFNGGTTTSDILFAGVPMVTCAGQAFAARMSASLLHVMDVAELICTDLGGYEALALSLARDPHRLKALRARLALGRDGAVLFDTKRFARALESGLIQMLERWRNQEAPSPLRIAAQGTPPAPGAWAAPVASTASARASRGGFWSRLLGR